MISHKHRCIFVHIPKTAGNSINRVFGVGWEDHKDLQRYYDEVPPEVFGSYFKFAIVRNPWDRLLSDYNYQVKKSRAPNSKLFVFGADGSKRNFAEWVETVLTAPDGYEAREWGGAVSPHIHRWSPQVDWISVQGAVRTDFIARLERLPEDFRAVRRQLQMPPVRLPHRNRRLHWHYSHYYDRATRELVARYYARDIAQFGYEFERSFLPVAFTWPGATHTPEAERHPETSAPAGQSGEPSLPAPAERATRGLSSPTPEPRARPPLWQRHPRVAAIAGLMISLGLFGFSAVATPHRVDDAAAADSAPPSVRRIVTRANAASRAEENLLVQARRLSRTISELDLSFDFFATAAPSGIVMVSLRPAHEAPALAPAVAPSAGRASSGSGPRWRLRRDRENSP
jgi:hypothetical protein